jgi:hypothetical protein
MDWTADRRNENPDVQNKALQIDSNCDSDSDSHISPKRRKFEYNDRDFIDDDALDTKQDQRQHPKNSNSDVLKQFLPKPKPKEKARQQIELENADKQILRQFVERANRKKEQSKNVLSNDPAFKDDWSNVYAIIKALESKMPIASAKRLVLEFLLKCNLPWKDQTIKKKIKEFIASDSSRPTASPEFKVNKVASPELKVAFTPHIPPLVAEEMHHQELAENEVTSNRGELHLEQSSQQAEKQCTSTETDFKKSSIGRTVAGSKSSIQPAKSCTFLNLPEDAWSTKHFPSFNCID